VEKTVSKPKPDGTGNNPMLVFGFDIEGYSKDPKLNKRQINFYNVVIGGSDKNGAPNSLNRLIEIIWASGIPWDHRNCGSEDMGKPPVEDKQEAAWICPECGKSLNEPNTLIAYDVDMFRGRMVKGQVVVGKMLGTDEPRNELRRVRPLNS